MQVVMGEPSSFRGPTPVGSHAYARSFAGAGHDVLWIGTPLQPVNWIRQRSEPDVRWRTRVWRAGGHKGDDTVTEYYPLTLLPVRDAPFLRSPFCINNTLNWTLPRLSGVVRELGYQRPDLLWLSQSRFSLPLLRSTHARLRTYRISDDWARFRGIPTTLARVENEIIDAVDAVFVTSRPLLERVRSRRRDAVYLPNGVSSIFFDNDDPEPAAIASLPRPRVVYVGSIAYWVDGKAIDAVASAIPGGSVVLVGPAEANHGFTSNNVHCVGPLPQPVLPAVLRHCDVAIIPFVPSELTHAVNPVKLYEYLATGIPVVATRLDEMAAIGSPAVLTEDTGAFVDAVAAFANGSAEWNRQSAVDFARGHTWANRFRIVMDVIR